MTTSEVDSYLAFKLLVRIFEAYQQDGILPAEETFHVSYLGL